MPVMQKLRTCAEKLGCRLNVSLEVEKAIDEAYDAVFEKKKPRHRT